MREFHVRRAAWPVDQAALGGVRRRVFIDEQQVPEALEWDGLDDDAQHLLAESTDGAAIGTVRLLADGHIGRMAVDADWRGQGVGSALLTAVIDEARAAGLHEVFLHAQVSAIAFYERAGVVAEGKVFMDDGIPHRAMRRRLG